MPSVSGPRAGTHKRQLKHIRVEKAANGFTVHKHYEQPGASYEARQPDPEPMVATSHAAAHKHVKAALAEMHPVPEGAADASMATGVAPVATNT